MPAGGGIRRIGTDGTGFQKLRGCCSPEYLPDGQHILYQDDAFWIMDTDGTSAKPVNAGAMDVSDLAQGFAYVAHFVATP